MEVVEGEREYRDQRNCILEIIRQEIYAKIVVRFTVYRDISECHFCSHSLKIGVNLAFVLTPNTAVKSSRQTGRSFSTNTDSLVETIRKFGQLYILS